MLVLRFVWASVIAGLDNWTGLHSWTGLLDSNFNALKILLSSPIIFIYTCRVAHCALTTCKIAILLQRGTHTFTYLCTISDV